MNEDNLFELNTDILGNFINVDRDNFVKYNGEYITKDLNKLFQIFDNLNRDDKDVFLRASEAYVDGLHSENGKELVYYIIALEILANYDSANDDSSKEYKIYSLICNLFNTQIISMDYIKYIYDIRSNFVHTGFLSNNISNIIFGVNELTPYLLSEVECIAYSVLIKWLLKKGE